MAALGNEYYNDYAYFIAGGKTLAAIQQFISDTANEEKLRKAIADELGADSVLGSARDMSIFAYRPLPDNPAYKIKRPPGDGSKMWVYTANPETPEGRALRARYEDIPQYGLLSSGVFARRLAGQEKVQTNPDGLQQDFGRENQHYREKNEVTSVSFQKIGDTYVVSVPRVIHGIFNEESARASRAEHYNQVAGYTIDWWTPPDSVQIPYSKVIEMQEKEKGDQLAPVTKTAKVPYRL